jgi:hypothetical protein
MRCFLVPSPKTLLIFMMWFVITPMTRADISIAYRTDCPQLNFAVSRLEQALQQVKETLVVCDLAEPDDKDILIL